MNQELQQSVTDVTNKGVNAASAWLATSGVLTLFDVVSKALGCFGILVGLITTIYFSRRKNKLYDRYEKELDYRDEQREKEKGNDR